MKNPFGLGLITAYLLAGCGNLFNSDADKANEYNLEALSHYQQGDMETARANYRKAVALEDVPDEMMADIFRNMSLSHSMEGNTDSSIFFLRQSNEYLEEGSYLFLVNDADIQLELGNPSKALPQLMKAQSMNRDDFRASNLLGLIYLGEYGDEYKDLDKALTYNRKAHEMNPDMVSAELLATNYILVEDFAKAAPIYKDLRNDYGFESYYGIMYGYCFFKQGDEPAAEQVWAQELAADSSYLWMVNEMRADTTLVY